MFIASELRRRRKAAPTQPRTCSEQSHAARRLSGPVWTFALFLRRIGHGVAAMIVSASRRTDIPALHWAWFMDRLRHGVCSVANPRNPSIVSSISLRPEDVDAIVFWSKNPAPMLPFVREIEAINPRFYVLFTLNDYPLDLEPAMPPVAERVAVFSRLSDMIGPARVVWRYDPIVLSSRTDADYHRLRFERLCGQLRTRTERVIVSVVDMYGSTRRALKRLESRGWRFSPDPAADPSLPGLLRDISGMAAAAGIAIQSCAEDARVNACGIRPGACIDSELIRRLWGRCADPRKDPAQRPACLCAVSRDIGMYGTCSHGCVYCYAGGADARVRCGSADLPHEHGCTGEVRP